MLLTIQVNIIMKNLINLFLFKIL